MQHYIVNMNEGGGGGWGGGGGGGGDVNLPNLLGYLECQR